MIHSANHFNDAWREIRQWPPQQRLDLARRILESLEVKAEAPQSPSDRSASLLKLIGVWQTDNPPTQCDVDQIVEEERMKKHG
jgi:hypothetical protein